MLQLEKDDTQEENAGLLQNYTRLQASVTELQTRVQEQEGKAVQKAQLDQEIQALRKNLSGTMFAETLQVTNTCSIEEYIIIILLLLLFYMFIPISNFQLQKKKWRG